MARDVGKGEQAARGRVVDEAQTHDEKEKGAALAEAVGERTSCGQRVGPIQQ